MKLSVWAWLLCGLLIFMATASAFAADKAAAIESQTKTQLKKVTALLDSWSGDGSILEDARIRLDEILGGHPDYAEAYIEYARYYIMRGYHNNDDVDPNALTAAGASLKKAIALNPKLARAYVLLGHWHFIQQQYDEAKSALTTAEKLGTDDPWLHNNWADVLAKEGDLEKAAMYYRKVIDSGTKNKKAILWALGGLENYYQKTNNFDDADKMYKKQLALDSNRAWTHGNYATFLLCYKGDAKAAANEFKAALKLMEYGMARNGLAAALYSKWANESLAGRMGDARATLSEADALMEGNPIDIIESACRNRSPALVDFYKAALQKSKP